MTTFALEIEEKAKALKMHPRTLCREAGLSSSIWDIWKAGGSPRPKNAAKIYRTIDRLSSGQTAPEVKVPKETPAARFALVFATIYGSNLSATEKKLIVDCILNLA